MRSIYTIGQREFRALITAPIGYVVMAFFLVISGIFFLAPLRQNIGSIRYVLANVTVWLIFLLPALTMRLLSEEKKQGTLELLMTAPVTETQVVLGKYLGVLAYYALMLFTMLQFVFALGVVRKTTGSEFFPGYVGLLLTAATLVAITLAALNESRPLTVASLVLAVATIGCAVLAARQMGEWGPVLTGFLGLFTLGGVFLAIGVLTSALTRHQIISWVVTAAVLLLLTFLIGWMTQSLPAAAPTLEASPNGWTYFWFGMNWIGFALMQVLQSLNLQSYLENFGQGVLDLRDFILSLSLITASLFFAVRGLTAART
jgi:ABC-2 type transport system permease protein